MNKSENQSKKTEVKYFDDGQTYLILRVLGIINKGFSSFNY